MQLPSHNNLAVDIYKTTPLRIISIREEAPEVLTFRLEFLHSSERQEFYRKYRVGQFGIYGLPGAGESVFCVASPPTRTDYIECTFRRAGRVTSALQDKDVGQPITFRGPYGNHFPLEEWRGKNLLFIAGGVGLPPVRSIIWNVLDRREEFGRITIVYGARTTKDLVYKHELAEWSARSDVMTAITVDPGGQSSDWQGRVGFVPDVVRELAPSGENAVAVVCGPPVMIKFTLPVLKDLGFQLREVFTTLENRMKCGVGKCGRCNVGSAYTCKDGPVFTAEQLALLPRDM